MSEFKLKKLQNYPGTQGPLLLVIMDGVGLGKQDQFDAVHLAKTPNLDTLKSTSLYTSLKAHGPAVGMPTDDDMGNSEVGHNTLGAGRAVAQGATLVQNAIQSGAIYHGKTWHKLIQNVIDKTSTLHFIGLLSDGNVHSHINHLISMLHQANSEAVQRCRIHVLLDGRDVDQKSALTYITTLESVLTTINAKPNRDYKIASGGGRMITTMDRYNADWSVVERGWKAHVLGDARQFRSATEAIQSFYNEEPTIIDQYLSSFVIADNSGPIGTIQDHDSVIFTNFRGDRAIELSVAFESKKFDKFNRIRTPKIEYAGMMEYDGDRHIPSQYLVMPPQIDAPISTYLCTENIRSFAISETQKYGHVTYFWNGNKSGYVNPSVETYVEIPSDKIPFDQKPEMKAYDITKKSIELLNSGAYKFGRINLPNGDMVGHTGNLAATINSIEVTDECVGQLVDTVTQLNGITIVLADHGNADEMATEKNGIITPKTSHSLNPVPCYIVDHNRQGRYKLNPIPTPGLSNVAATICNLLGFEAPDGYDDSLINFQ